MDIASGLCFVYACSVYRQCFFFWGGGVEWGGVGTYFEALTTVTRDVKFAMSKVTTDV